MSKNIGYKFKLLVCQTKTNKLCIGSCVQILNRIAILQRDQYGKKE